MRCPRALLNARRWQAAEAGRELTTVRGVGHAKGGEAVRGHCCDEQSKLPNAKACRHEQERTCQRSRARVCQSRTACAALAPFLRYSSGMPPMQGASCRRSAVLGIPKAAISRRLTFELTGPQRQGAWAERRRIDPGAERPKRLAGASPVERLVRRRSRSKARP